MTDDGAAARLRKFRRDHPDYRAREAARMRAMTVLRHRHDDEYQEIYQQELAKEARDERAVSDV